MKRKKDGTPKQSGGKRLCAGRPTKEPRTVINFSITVKNKAILKAKYGKKLNKMFNLWALSLIAQADSVYLKKTN